MLFTPEVVEELNVLMRFSMESIQQGIKIHSNAEPALIAAGQRLYDKGVLSQADGGYLTDLGLEAIELAEKLINIMNSSAELVNK